MIDCKSGRLAIWLSYHYMQETEVRDMTLPEGHTVSLEMWRIHWVLYDRLCEHLDFFEKNIPKVLEKYRDKGNEEMNLQLVCEVEAMTQLLLKEGKDPLETRGQRLVRQAKMWKFNQSRPVKDSEGGRA